MSHFVPKVIHSSAIPVYIPHDPSSGLRDRTPSILERFTIFIFAGLYIDPLFEQASSIDSKVTLLAAVLARATI